VSIQQIFVAKCDLNFANTDEPQSHSKFRTANGKSLEKCNKEVGLRMPNIQKEYSAHKNDDKHRKNEENLPFDATGAAFLFVTLVLLS